MTQNNLFFLLRPKIFHILNVNVIDAAFVIIVLYFIEKARHMYCIYLKICAKDVPHSDCVQKTKH